MIREVELNDIEDINKLGNKLFDNFTNKYNIKEYLQNSKYIMLLYETSSIIAFLLIYNNIDNYELEAIIVDENNRNKGIGSKLINYFLDNYSQKDIILEVSSKNINAIKLYKKFGFEIINKRKNYYKDSDALIMKRVV